MDDKKIDIKNQDRGFGWFSARLMSCKLINPLVGESLERILTVREKIVSKLHLLMCRDCRTYLSNLKFMRKAYRQKEQSAEVKRSATALDPEARERMKEALKTLS